MFAVVMLHGTEFLALGWHLMLSNLHIMHITIKQSTVTKKGSFMWLTVISEQMRIIDVKMLLYATFAINNTEFTFWNFLFSVVYF